MTPRHAESGWKDGWYRVPREVTWRDLDGIGHVNNAVYFTYFEHGRTDYWFALHGGGNSAADLGFIVARAECDFKQQLGLTERIEVCVRIGEMRNSSLDFVYEIRRSGSGELVASGKVVSVLYSWEQNRKQPITEDFRERVARFQSQGD